MALERAWHRDTVAAVADRHRHGVPAASDARLSAWSDRNFKWLLVAPAVILIFALSIFPLLFSIWVAFVNYDFQIPGHAFVGLKNFRAGGRRSGGPVVAGR